MKIKIAYTLNTHPEQELEDILNWPDVSTIEGVTPHVTVYLDQKYDKDNYHVVGIEEAGA